MSELSFAADAVHLGPPNSEKHLLKNCPKSATIGKTVTSV